MEEKLMYFQIKVASPKIARAVDLNQKNL